MIKLATFSQREALLEKNKISLTECSCDKCGAKGFIINREEGFYCTKCEKYPLGIYHKTAFIVNERKG